MRQASAMSAIADKPSLVVKRARVARSKSSAEGTARAESARRRSSGEYPAHLLYCRTGDSQSLASEGLLFMDHSGTHNVCRGDAVNNSERASPKRISPLP